MSLKFAVGISILKTIFTGDSSLVPSVIMAEKLILSSIKVNDFL
ncbi:hypothetical protein [Photobacterium frigidiphilum]